MPNTYEIFLRAVASVAAILVSCSEPSQPVLMDFQQEISGYLHKTASSNRLNASGDATRGNSPPIASRIADAADHYFAIALLGKIQKSPGDERIQKTPIAEASRAATADQTSR